MGLEIYLRSEIAQGIEAALRLAAKMYVANGGTNVEHLRGMFDLAEQQTAQYGLSWPSILHNVRQSLSVDVMEVLEPAWPVLKAGTR
jgi:hypothetical protein